LQPDCIQKVVEQLQADADLVQQLELEELDAITLGLEPALEHMDSIDQGMKPFDLPVGPDREELVPTTYEVIFDHSRISPHARWVWITKNSTVDAFGNLGYPASREEIRKFGSQARKVFIRHPSTLQKSFTGVVKMNQD
jgi:hypothetical protein